MRGLFVKKLVFEASVLRSLAVCLLVSGGVSVASADWVEVPAGEGMKKYVQLGLQAREDQVIRVNELLNFEAPVLFSGVPIASILWQGEYQCEQRKTRVVAYAGFAGPMAQGPLKLTGQEPVAWAAIPSGSLASKVWALLCRV